MWRGAMTIRAMTLPNDPHLFATLKALATVMERNACDNWWVIGSAAVALHGGDPGQMGDVDVIVSLQDFSELESHIPLADTREGAGAAFRSDCFGCWSEPAIRVEFMAGFKLRVGDDWQPVQPRTREAITLDEHKIFVPERGELIAILHSFGRAKDLRRAATLLGV